MNRRDFLTLVAAAPIAALAPWPKILEQRETATAFFDAANVTYFLAFNTPPQTVQFSRLLDGTSWDVPPDTMRALAQHSRLVERDVARDTLGSDSLEEYLAGPRHRTAFGGATNGG